MVKYRRQVRAKAAGTEYKVRVCASWQVQTEAMCWCWWTDGGGRQLRRWAGGAGTQMKTTKLRV